MRLELSASPGAARLVVVVDGQQDTYVIGPAELGAWSAATAKLLALLPASRADERAEFRAPYLTDREGRASIAVEGLVSELGVRYRLLVRRASGTVRGIMTDAELTRGLAEAAAGAAALAGSTT